MRFQLEGGLYRPKDNVLRDSAYKEFIFDKNGDEKPYISMHLNVIKQYLPEKGDMIVRILITPGYKPEIKVHIIDYVYAEYFFAEEVFYGALEETQVLRKKLRETIQKYVSNLQYLLE